MVWIDLVKIAAIIAVIVFHVDGELLHADDIYTSTWWASNIVMAAVHWCVPVFVMISGALLLDPQKTESLATFYRKRLARVLLPLVFWGVFYLGWIWFKGAIRNEPPSVISLIRLLIEGRPYYHMWFLYMILGLYFFTPFFRKIIATTSTRDLWILVICMLALMAGHEMLSVAIAWRDDVPIARPPFLGLFLPFIPYFFLGYLIRFKSPQPSVWLLWLVLILTIGLSAGGYYASRRMEISQLGNYFYSNQGIGVVCSSIVVLYLFKTCRWSIVSASFTRTLSMLTLGVYLIHPIILECFTRTGLGFGIKPSAWWILVLSLLVAVASFLACWIIQKIPLLKKTI